jgi:8-hydroxy-5-deazaflavin:NADPH oxidoreductase
MKIGVIGTGMVGQTLAGKLSELGHDVVLGTRDVAVTKARTQKGPYGGPSFAEWHQQHPKVKLADLPETARHGEVLINATNGSGSLEALRQAGASNLRGKILVDIANPLDFSKGMPPSLTVCNTDSLAEQIQKAFPDTTVVKTLNTVNAMLMVNPALVGNAEHHLFVSGNDARAKDAVVGYLKAWFGWKHIIDLGDITTARGTEMMLPIWIRLMGTLKTPMFNFRIMQ